VATRASIIIWSAGSGLLLGVFIDAALVGIWMVISALLPALAPRVFPRWLGAVTAALLAAVPLALAAMGYLEGRLKTN
jgi:hypothetical protein